MTRQNGFAPLFILLFAGAVITAGTLGYSYIYHPAGKNVQSTKEIPSFSGDFALTSPTLSPAPTLKPAVEYIQPTPTIVTSTGTVSVYLTDNGNAIMDNSLWLHFRNENTQEEKLFQNTSSAWKISDIKPGKYKITVPFSYTKYFNPERNCEGCRDKEDKSDFEICGYVLNILAGDNVKISCMLRATHPLDVGSTNSSTSGPDTSAPNTNIYYPQPNGSITYKIDGKVCAITTQPNDNQGPNGIETEYKFDGGSWSGYAGGRGYLCADSLSNGPHTLSYHSKDKAGNVEATKTISFTVNIPGN